MVMHPISKQHLVQRPYTVVCLAMLWLEFMFAHAKLIALGLGLHLIVRVSWHESAFR